MTETTKRILDLMQENNLNAHQLEVAVNLPNASVQSWVKGKRRKDGNIVETTPSADSIVKLARYFNVSADYLLCLTNEPRPLENRDITERSTYALSTELAKSYQRLCQDRIFQDTVKIFDNIEFEYRSIVFGCILGVLQTLKVNTQQILGY